MPIDLLLELETTIPAPADLEALEKRGSELEQALQDYLENVGRALEGMRGSADGYSSLWRSVVLLVARGETVAIHAAHQQLVDAFEKRLHLLKRTCALATELRGRYREKAVPDPDILLAEITDMQRLKAKVFDRWRTAENLEDLAARDYPLATGDLERIGRQRRPSASWYEGESRKPF